MQHLTSFYGQMLIDLYKGDGRGAWHRVTSTWPELEASLVAEDPARVHRLAAIQRPASALAAARQGEPAGPLLKHAERTARILDRQRLPWADAFAAHLRAGIASIRGDEAAAVALLRRAIDGFDAGRPEPLRRRRPPPARPAHRRRRGKALIARCDAWMAGQGIRVPEKMVRACVSGFPE